MDNKIKIIFLDIDGVLNSVQSAIMDNRNNNRPYYDFCPICKSNLMYITEKVKNIKFVISSTWRCNKTKKDLQEIFKKEGFDEDLIIGLTPWMGGKQRGTEIQQWLYSNQNRTYQREGDNCLYWKYSANCKGKFIILDDDSDMVHLKKYLFQTKTKLGLDFITAEKIIEYFNEEKQ